MRYIAANMRADQHSDWAVLHVPSGQRVLFSWSDNEHQAWDYAHRLNERRSSAGLSNSPVELVE